MVFVLCDALAIVAVGGIILTLNRIASHKIAVLFIRRIKSLNPLPTLVLYLCKELRSVFMSRIE